jgi:hypothetical protein
MYNFSNNYNRENFVDFLENNFLPEDFQAKEENLTLSFNPKFTSSVTRLGSCKSLELEVFEIEHNSTHDARVGISRDAFQVMQKNSYCNKALVAFIPKGSNQYRFSFLQIDAEQKDHSARIQRNYSNPRRYSYLLGEGVGGYTPNKFLFGKGRVKDGKDLAERFSVEVLTKAFYGELSDWYAWAIKTVQFPGEHEIENDEKRIEHRSKNVIRLLTRLLFVWFLKQKNLIPSELFDINFLSNQLLKDFDPNLKTGLFAEKSHKSKYYKAILQNLFFATLNCPITPQSKEDSRTRGFRKQDWYGQGFGYDHLMRYEELFTNPQLFLDLVNAKVPFLNGGLFDCLDDKQNKIYIDGFSDNLPKPNMLIIPDFLFFGERKGEDLSDFYGDKKKKSVDALGLIDILQKYNFTIEENTPFDQDVSLDPELLGKVFENLLASYNPETKTTARKQTGSFYTPREIVQYMVDESLIAYLKQSVGEKYEDEYRKLMQYADETLNISDDVKQAIIQSIQKCKVLDPACGSGAFPVGVLQQMVHVLSQLDPQNEIWKSLILEESIKELSSTLKDYTKEEREEIQIDINRSFDDNINRPDYARKLYLIERCIYGVDIQSIAVQISKLRFFISLVVDQCPTHNPEDNFGIRPLPNLEAKFVAANTLIGLSKTKTLFDSPEVEKLQEKLNQTNHRIFGAKSNKSKNKYKARVEELQTEIAEKLEELGVVGNDDARLMQQWKMFDQNASSPFFDPEWMFGLKSGASNQDGYFDIVIGNPPYVEAKKLKYISLQLKIYHVYSGTADLSIYFIEKGLDFCKSGGNICYITTNKFFNTGYGKPVRKFFLNNEIDRIVDFEQVEVFDNVLVSSVVLGVKKSNEKKDSFIYQKFYKLKKEEFRKLFVERKSQFGKYEQKVLSENEWSFSDNQELRIKEKIEKSGVKICDLKGVSVFRGVTTGYNPAFIIDTEKRNQFIDTDPNNEKIIKPLLQGRNIRKWIYYYNNDYLIFTKQGIDIDSFPIIKSYLKKYYSELKPREGDEKGGRKPGSYNWFEIQDNTAYYPEFEKSEKIIWGLTADKWAFAYDDKQHYLPSNGYILTSNVVSIKYLLALLNSNLLKYYFGFIGVMTAGGAYTLKHATIQQLPIVLSENQKPIIDLVDKILFAKVNNNNTAILEKKLDEHIYSLYNLTDKEIEIIENS